MPLFGFKKQFVPFILDGSKQHTIRAARKYPTTVGDTCHLYTGLRQKGAHLLGRVPCVMVEEIQIERARIWVDSIELMLDEKRQLAYCDGFRDPDGLHFDAMLAFWANNHGDAPFHGQIIHWEWSKRISQ